MLQFITDSPTAECTVAQAMQALDGGCRWVQVRMKGAPDRDVEAAVRALLPHTRTLGATLIVDDRVDVVSRTGADGVHLGKDDMPPAEARAILGPGSIIGSTVNTLADIERLPLDLIDYLGMGPYRFTTTKKRLAPVLGLDGYREAMAALRRQSAIPVVAIGGITLDDVVPLLATGVTGVAVSGAISRADNPGEATRCFINLTEHKQQ